MCWTKLISKILPLWRLHFQSSWRIQSSCPNQHYLAWFHKLMMRLASRAWHFAYQSFWAHASGTCNIACLWAHCQQRRRSRGWKTPHQKSLESFYLSCRDPGGGFIAFWKLYLFSSNFFSNIFLIKHQFWKNNIFSLNKMFFNIFSPFFLVVFKTLIVN